MIALKKMEIEMSFEDFKSTNKGEYGEAIVDEILAKKGYTIYSPVAGSHLIDRFVVKKGKVYGLDVKTKPKRKFYPDTGFDVADYEKYKKLRAEHNMEVLIVFVDEDEGSVYGNFLSKLEVPYEDNRNSYPFKSPPDRHNKVCIYFPISNMSTIRNLTEKEIEILKSLSSNYDDKSEVEAKALEELNAEINVIAQEDYKKIKDK